MANKGVVVGFRWHVNTAIIYQPACLPSWKCKVLQASKTKNNCYISSVSSGERHSFQTLSIARAVTELLEGECSPKASRRHTHQHTDHSGSCLSTLGHTAVWGANLSVLTVTDKNLVTQNGKVEKRKSTVRQQEFTALLRCVRFHTFYMLGSAPEKHFLKFNCHCTFSRYAGISDFFLCGLTAGSAAQRPTFLKRWNSITKIQYNEVSFWACWQWGRKKEHHI